MKSWGVFVTAVGFLVGMVLAGIGGISAKTFDFSVNKRANTSKNIDLYWQQTGIGKKELFELISNTKCQSSEKYFLSCVNSIVQVLPAYHLYLSSINGKLESDTKKVFISDLTEKEKLTPFVQMYAHQKNSLIDFESVWSQLLLIENDEKIATLIANGVSGFLSIYKDPHTYILPATYYDEVSSQLERSNLFVGVSFEKINNQIKIRKVTKNSDAEFAGLKNQDVVISIDKKSVEDMNLMDISQILKNSEKNEFLFEISRANQIKKIEIKRRRQSLSHVQFELLKTDKKMALITLTKFNRGACEDISKKMKELDYNNVAGFILDLRDNPGGQLDEAACIAGLFVGINKKIYSVEYFDPVKSNEVVLTTGSLQYTGPLVVMVNSSSASASELLAGALQDYKRAVLVGEVTFGKGTFQEPETWTKNSNVSLFRTQGFYLLPSRKSTQLVGVTPDVEVIEPHQHNRELNTYFHPIQNGNLDFQLKSQLSMTVQKNLKNCNNSQTFDLIDDVILKESIRILSCQGLVSAIATEFNSQEFN